MNDVNESLCYKAILLIVRLVLSGKALDTFFKCSIYLMVLGIFMDCGTGIDNICSSVYNFRIQVISHTSS